MSFFNADTLVSGTDGLLLKDLGDNATTPSSGYGTVYVNADALYFKSDDGTATNLLSSGGASALNDLSDVSYSSGDLVITSLDTIKYANSTNAELNVTAVSGTNISGKNLTISAGQGTGTGEGGSIIFKVADGDASGSSANPLETAVTINDEGTLKITKNANTAGITKPTLHIEQNNTNYAFTLNKEGETKYWGVNIGISTEYQWWFVDSTEARKAYLVNNGTDVQLNFTGQHRSIMNNNITTSSVGLIVSSTGKYVNLDNNIISNINESLPVCDITSENNDKKVFGVLSDKEDTEIERNYSTGCFVSVYQKHNTNEQRMFINSLGEGALWVCNKNGNIDNGDYISSSTVPGYGVKQADDLLHNYTVAKLTCDCNFSTTKIVKQKLKVTSTTSNGVTTTAIDYDSNGDVQYENDLDENNNQQMVYPLDTRFLQADGTQITESDYTTRLGNGESVYIACFVGCTYHCG